VRGPLCGPSLDLEAKFRAEEALDGLNVLTSLPIIHGLNSIENQGFFDCVESFS
jgi:hypothetical protein